MNEQAKWRTALVQEQIAPAYVAQTDVAVILLVGSVAWGVVDAWSDIDMVMYWDEMPSPELLKSASMRLDGVIDSDESGDTSDSDTDISLMSWGEVFYMGGKRGEGLKIDISHKTLASAEKLFHDVLYDHDTHFIKLHAVYAVQRAKAVHGANLLESWKTQLAEFPAALVEKLIHEYLGALTTQWAFEMLAERGDTLYLLQYVQETLWTTMQVLLVLNRVYPAGRPKHQLQLLSEMPLQPKNYAARLTQIMTLNPDPVAAVTALIDLVEDIYALIAAHEPQIDLTAKLDRFRYRRAKWRVNPTLKPTGLT